MIGWEASKEGLVRTLIFSPSFFFLDVTQLLPLAAVWMRIKVLSRNEEEYTRQRPTDLARVQHVAASSSAASTVLHPFERQREYVRALNAAKLDRVFAKPFVASLEGHADGVYCLSRHPNRLATLVSGACDGGSIPRASVPFFLPALAPPSDSFLPPFFWFLVEI